MITVLRIANRSAQRKKGKIASIPEAVEILSPEGVETLAARTATFDFFERTPGWDLMPERFRLHAVATQAAADRLARELEYDDRDELLCSALLHDIGKLVLGARLPGLPGADPRRRPARPRSASTRSGSSWAWTTRWSAACSPAAGGCRTGWRRRSSATTPTTPRARPRSSASPTCSPTTGTARPVNPKQLLQAARACGLTTEQLRAVMYELPQGTGNAKRNVDPCPLSAREVEVLKRLAEGKVYKQIAHELELSTSTVRTHLHNTYAKLGAVDRAQAVLIATERGWI